MALNCLRFNKIDGRKGRYVDGHLPLFSHKFLLQARELVVSSDGLIDYERLLEIMSVYLSSVTNVVSPFVSHTRSLS